MCAEGDVFRLLDALAITTSPPVSGESRKALSPLSRPPGPGLGGEQASPQPPLRTSGPWVDGHLAMALLGGTLTSTRLTKESRETARHALGSWHTTRTYWQRTLFFFSSRLAPLPALSGRDEILCDFTFSKAHEQPILSAANGFRSICRLNVHSWQMHGQMKVERTRQMDLPACHTSIPNLLRREREREREASPVKWASQSARYINWCIGAATRRIADLHRIIGPKWPNVPDLKAITSPYEPTQCMIFRKEQIKWYWKTLGELPLISLAMFNSATLLNKL